MERSIIIVIPVYRQPSADEAASLHQCMRVLGRYDVCLVCPEGLDTTAYDRIARRTLPTQRFEQRYFEGIEGYNSLLFSTVFYAGFRQYDYMLIYQLDAWVFSDQLAEWCQKGYDYVGAPWFYRNRSHEEGMPLWLVGNGGLSLRKISKFMEITAASRIQFKLSFALSGDFYRISDRYKYVLKYIKLNGCSFPELIKGARKPWEDLVFCWELRGSNYQLAVPSVEEAAQFAIETSPAFIYENVTHCQLPFGCHAWRKNEYDSFWSRFINIEC